MKKPTYEELEKRVKELEKAEADRKKAEEETLCYHFICRLHNGRCRKGEPII